MKVMTTQQEKILRLLQSRPNEWVGLPNILSLGVAQYGARILELRRMGYNIENKLIEVVGGQRHTAFRLVTGEEHQMTGFGVREKVTNAHLAAG
jgi:hypothetical protein